MLLWYLYMYMISCDWFNENIPVLHVLVTQITILVFKFTQITIVVLKLTGTAAIKRLKLPNSGLKIT